MNTKKAYLAGLGTTAILIGSAVLTLMLGTGFVAFSGAPELDDSPSRLEKVVIRKTEPRARHAPVRRQH